MSRPVIAVPTQTLQAIEGIPAELPRSWVMNHYYFKALALAGGAPVMVPLMPDDEELLRSLYDRADGIFLAGGVDVDPSAYEEDRLDVCGITDPDRDQVELMFTRWAIAEGKPVLGVCRGLQLINVACGGSLLQDVESSLERALKHDFLPGGGFERDHIAHDVTLQANTKLHEIFGTDVINVNSLHHQGIKRLADTLVSSAVAPDGLIEGIEGTGDNYLLGVQWHPEMMVETDPATRRLFESFVEACALSRASIGR